MSNRDRRQTAFTLVELLVVIGIIAVLISILLPVLGKARESANSVRCMSNLKQIAQGVLIYENTYKSLPGPTLRAILDPAVYRHQARFMPASVLGTLWTENDGFMRSMGSRSKNDEAKIWACPSNLTLRDEARPLNAKGLLPTGTSFGYSYRINNAGYTNKPHFFGYWFDEDAGVPASIKITRDDQRPKKLSEVDRAGSLYKWGFTSNASIQTGTPYDAATAANGYIRNGDSQRGAAAIWMLADIDGYDFSDAQSANFGIEDGNLALSKRKWQPPHRKNKELSRNYAFFDGHCEGLEMAVTPGGIPGRASWPKIDG